LEGFREPGCNFGEVGASIDESPKSGTVFVQLEVDMCVEAKQASEPGVERAANSDGAAQMELPLGIRARLGIGQADRYGVERMVLRWHFNEIPCW
jgi:hypothetical protein